MGKLDVEEYPGGDEKLIADLRGAEKEAVIYLMKWVVQPVALSRANRPKVEDTGSSCEELLSDVYYELVHRNKLALFERKCRFVNWARNYTQKFISEKVVKYRQIASDLGGEDVPPYEGADVDVLDELRLAEKCLIELWREYPMRGFIHLMKAKFSLSSREIADFCGGISLANVDQMASRAAVDMRAKWARYQGEA